MRRILKVKTNHFTKKILKDVGLIVSLFKGTMLMNKNNFWKNVFFYICLGTFDRCVISLSSDITTQYKIFNCPMLGRVLRNTVTKFTCTKATCTMTYVPHNTYHIFNTVLRKSFSLGRDKYVGYILDACGSVTHCNL